ncbi:MAG: hypothetical protein ACP5K2_03105 [bacterium]
MTKEKEGIALILAIVFMLALTILLSAILLLSTQEINATQLYLDGNKALYYAEAGVEYAQARILNGDSVDVIVRDVFSHFGNNIIKSFYIDTLGNLYKFTCEAQYNRTKRKVVKQIELLYPGLWDKVMASEGNIAVNVNQAQGGRLVIEGNIHSNGNITANDPITINGKVSVAKGGSISNNINATEKITDAPRLSFPMIDFDEYRAKSSYIFYSETDFVNALKNGSIVKNSSVTTFVYIDGDLHLRNLEGLDISGLCITVNGDIHVNNTRDMTIDGGSKLVTLISKNLKYNNDAKITFKNCIIYTEQNVNFTNMKGDVSIEEGAIYAKTGYIGLNNIKKEFRIIGGNFSYSKVAHLFDVYEVRLWSDSGV